ncbi:MAG: enoyl-CoA hydratase/isomerase family protein [Promethearchaeota archaeon]|jgi:enoyl-CoA hydratase/carnithine racemase
MEYKNYQVYKIEVKQGVAFVTIDNPPINLINRPFWEDMERFFTEVKTDDDVRVIVFQSADPTFFISHFDVSLLTEYPDEPAPAPTELGGWKKYFMEFRTLPKVTIAKIEGICGGGGSEFVLSMDMRFGAIGKAVFQQGEAGVGIIAGGGGTHWLTRFMGGPRAMEVMLARFPFSAKLAERYGWINRAIPADKIDQFVEQLAYSIASVPAETIALVKKSIIIAEELPRKEALLEEQHLFNISAALPESKRRMKEFVSSGGQSRDRESGLAEFAKQMDEFLKEKD